MLTFKVFKSSKVVGRRYSHVKHKLSEIYQPSNYDPVGSKSFQKGILPCKSLKLMQENGLIHNGSPGTFHLLPLGLRSINKLIRLIDEEMVKISAQKLELGCLIPRSLLEATGRWSAMESELFQLKDRQNRDLCLGPTHEETVTDLVVTSRITQRNLPLRLYQISKKFRDEPRPKYGLLRAREFLMKDLYTFDKTIDDAKAAYHQVDQAYKNIFKNLGLKTVKVQAATGNIGGNYSHEYHLLNDIGEDRFLFCSSCYEGVSDELNDPSDTCSKCNSKLEIGSGIEVAHSFLLGTRYSLPLNASVITDTGVPSHLEMGCYGLGVSRLLAAGIEVLSVPDEIRWPNRLAPFQLCIIPPKKGSKEEPATELATHLYHKLSELFVDDVVYDDRSRMTIGERLVYARKIGYPHVVIAAKKALGPTPLFEVHDLYARKCEFMTYDELLQYFRKE